MSSESTSEHLLPVQIWRIYPYSDVTPHESFLVVLKGKEEKFVPISIGFPEGQYLVMAMQQVKFPRPLTHNLIKHLVEKIKGSIHQLVIHTLRDETFHAYLLVQTPDEVFYLDCRPSDGMILATLMGIPIFMSPEVMNEAGRELSGMLNISGAGEDALADGMDDAGEDTENQNPVLSEALVEVELGSEDADPEELEISVAVEEPQPTELDSLKARLDQLVAAEAYEEAARVRDRISELKDDQPHVS